MKNMIVVYGKCSGVATVATFLGNQWWVTSKDERLEHLYSVEPYDKSDYRYLCEKDELIQVKDLAGMMGCAMECGGANIKEVLKSRFKDINALGVKFMAMPQVLNLEVNALFLHYQRNNFSFFKRNINDAVLNIFVGGYFFRIDS